ncbi:Microcystin-dependent protein [Jatrophihabitans endophyticus]|uniref:Microcystin-dependent protein n=1 Tax=Jatrophihabitans endophyticus TaxID=1206085 RepID=A0A1M5KBB4_9ACTN|nr:tail fiber protein [Jatrophihabitans endophyticus]SHG49463.1 Microcystin-dependent protein [Jatrophihabitans endophyticus]
MSDPYIGEIKTVSFNFAPSGWALCNGQTLPINQNQALFAVLGIQYGGDGVTTFRLPNLQGRIPVHQGRGFVVGNAGGEAGHVLTNNEMPAHVHPAMAQSTASTPGASPAGSVWATAAEAGYAPAPNALMAPGAVSDYGSNQPHENRPPYLVLNFIISLQGVYPSRS